MKILLIPARLNKFGRRKDSSVSFSFISNIEVSNEEFALIDQYYQQNGHLAFKLNEFDGTEIPDTDAANRQGEKSPSQQLRLSLFAKHMNDGGTKDSFPAYYKKAILGFKQAVDDSWEK